MSLETTNPPPAPRRQRKGAIALVAGTLLALNGVVGYFFAAAKVASFREVGARASDDMGRQIAETAGDAFAFAQPIFALSAVVGMGVLAWGLIRALGARGTPS